MENRIQPKNRKKPNFEVFGKIFDPVIPGMMGVGSPLLYGVTLPLGRPFVTACLGGGFGVLWPAAWRPPAGALRFARYPHDGRGAGGNQGYAFILRGTCHQLRHGLRADVFHRSRGTGKRCVKDCPCVPVMPGAGADSCFFATNVLNYHR